MHIEQESNLPEDSPKPETPSKRLFFSRKEHPGIFSFIKSSKVRSSVLLAGLTASTIFGGGTNSENAQSDAEIPEDPNAAFYAALEKVKNSLKIERPESPEVTALKEDILKKYNISMLEANDYYDSIGLLVADFTFSLMRETKWDSKTINMVDEYLDSLPPKFYEPFPNGDNLKLVLGMTNLCGYSHTLPDNIKNTIVLSPNNVNYRWPQDSMRILTHELAHKATLENCAHGREHEAETNEYYLAVNDVLGEDFAVDRLKYTEHIEGKLDIMNQESDSSVPERKSKMDNLQTQEQREMFWLARLHYGFYYEEPSEFLAVAAEFYVFGKDYFTEVYSLIYPEEIVENLYKMMNELIFEGREYNNNLLKTD